MHEEVLITEQDVADRLDTMLLALDQPSVDGINSFVVSEAARRGVTVSLSGMGGDELFAGYGHFERFLRADARFSNGNKLAAAGYRLGEGWLPGRWRSQLEFHASPATHQHSMIRRLFTHEEKSRLLNSNLTNGTVFTPIESFYGGLLRTIWTRLLK